MVSPKKLDQLSYFFAISRLKETRDKNGAQCVRMNRSRMLVLRTLELGVERQALSVLSCLLNLLWLFIATSVVAEDANKADSDVPSLAQTVAFSSGSEWTLSVAAVQKYGLIITHAKFQKSPDSTPVTILHDGRLGEIFVPYHPGFPRFGDISEFDFSPLPLTAVHLPPPPRVATLIANNTICKERRTYLAWIDHEKARYGEEVIYFAVLDAANYNYIMEWTCRDDGTIIARAGSTGQKLGGPDDKTGHMHNFTWRLDIDLNGPAGDTAYFTRHVEDLKNNPSTARDDLEPILIEGSRAWDPKEFNTLEIFDSKLQNGNGRRTSYELVPLRSGTARHSEPFTKKDFWVTRFNPTEILAPNLPTYIADGQSTHNADIVVWYTGSVHHENDPRDEDRDTVPVLWTGFELRPKNLFDRTPFFHD